MNVSFIPVRGGSKSIPLKNIKLLNGKPLVYWALKAACYCKYIDKVYVATDSDDIKTAIEVEANNDKTGIFDKIEVIGRSKESSSDTASTEMAMLEFAEKYEFDNVVLIQATSPLLKSTDLDRGFEIYGTNGTDSVLSVVRQKRFNWMYDEKGFVHPTNYDVFNRPRRQEFEGYLVENGAFYISSRKGLLKSKNRVSGNIKAVEMHEDSFFEIDELSDWVIIEELMKKNEKKTKMDMPEIKIFLTDCDGCLTDGGMYYSEKGDEIKKFNTRDGMGFSLLREKGILTGIVTAESVELNRRRGEKLKLDFIETGCKDKLKVIRQICNRYSIDLKNVCYVGDDINDLEAVATVGFGCCPADAQDSVKNIAKYIAGLKGGNGAVREIIDYIIARG